MGYFNPISYFIKSFIKLFTRKFFWIILILIFLFFVLSSIEVKAVDNGVFGQYYGSFLNGMTITINDVDNIIQQHKSNFDSFIIRQWGNSSNWYLYGCFYNESYAQKVYRMYFNDGSSALSTQRYGVPDNNTSPTIYFRIDNNLTYTEYPENNPNNTGGFHDFAVQENSQRGFYTNRTIYLSSTQLSTVLYSNTDVNIQSVSPYTEPYIINSTDISTWSFDTLNISLGSIIYDSNNSYYLRYTLNGVDYGIELRDYYNASLGYFVVPRNQLTNNVVVRNNDSFDFTLIYRSLITVTPFELGTFTISISSGEQEQINQDSDKYVQGQILEQQKQTNEKLDDINNTQHETNEKLENLDNTITDSSIEDITNDTLPSDNTNDITSEGVNGIFTSIYNAFCTGEAQDIVFPIPFTDKNISLSADYVSSSLQNSGASFVIIIIQAFWWYLISRFIIKDVMNKINKIKSGNIEKIEETNIRGDML